MSKSTESRDTRTVYVASGSLSDKHWHDTDEKEECSNVSDSMRSVELWKLKGSYQPCSICSGEETEITHNATQREYECAGCGQHKQLGVTAARTLHACGECDDVMSWERING